jgi:hypothetical protein
MEPKVFEHELNLVALQGSLRGGITDVIVEELVTNGTNQIIRFDSDWKVTVKWELVGTLLDSTFFTFPGKWILNAYLEGWGEDADELDLMGDTANGLPVMTSRTVVLANSIAPGDPPETEWHFQETFTIHAADNPDPGLYRLAVAITYRDEKDDPGPMAGFIEIPEMVQIYEPKKRP